MVKHIKTIAAVCTVAILALVGCSNVNNGAIIGDSTGTTSINLSVSNQNNLHALIAPDTLKRVDITKYQIEGESLSGKKYPQTGQLAEVTLDANGKGKLENIEVDDWTFTLHAYTGDAAPYTEVLKGTSTCMLKSGTDVSSVAFTLSSYGVSTTGGYSITIGYTGGAWNEGYTFTYGVYNSTTGAPISENAITTDTDKIVYDSADTTNHPGYPVTGSGLAAGSYIFGVRISKGSATLAYVSDVLIIEPGRTTEGTLIFGDVISTLPAAPSGLIAQELLNNTYKPEGDYYKVRLYWKDNAINEESYELIVREFTDTSTKWDAYTENADDTTISAAFGTRYDFADILTLTRDNNKFNIGYVAGSLYAGSEELVLDIPTGRMYDFQIRAKNLIGTSASIVRVKNDTAELAYLADTASATQTKINTIAGDCKGYDISDAAEPTFYKHVNLVQTSYSLDGGTLKITSADTFAGDVYVTYTIYDMKYTAYTTATSPDPTAYPSTYLPLLKASDWHSLKKENADWSGWNTDIARVATPVEYNINGYKNITVVAQYGSSITDVNITGVDIEALPTLADDNITCFYGDDPATANTYACKNGTITIARGADAKYVTVTVASSATDIFKKYDLYVNGSLINSRTSGANFSFANFSTKKMKSGVANTIMVVGTTASGRKASSSFNIKLTN
ncbi:MAG: hypothetical protein IKS40_06435 [Treponema sp.]|nr:hypothetical protein [Treponema sp.]